MVALVYRFTQEGFAEFEKQLLSLGETGKAALDKIKATMPEFADAFDKAKEKAEAHRKKLEENAAATSGLSAQLTNANKLLGLFGAALSAGAVISFATDLFKSTAALEGQARALGVGIENLQAYRAAAVRAGDDISAADAAVQRLTLTIGRANEGAGEQRKAFQDLKLTANDLAGGTDAALPRVAAALLSVKDASERARLATILFGQSVDVAMLQYWADPSHVQRMKELGLVIDENLVKRAAAADAAWNEFWKKQKVRVVEFVGWLATHGPPNPWDWALDPNDPRRTDNFANAQTTAKGLANALPFAGPDSLAIAGIGKKGPAWTDDAEKKQIKEDIAGFWRDVGEVEANHYEKSVAWAKAAWAEVDKLRADERKEIADFWADVREVENRAYQESVERAKKYWGDVDKLREKSGDDYDEGIKKQKELTKEYWENAFDDARYSLKSFWLEFVDTGVLNFKRLGQQLKSLWASILFDMAEEAIRKQIKVNLTASSTGAGGAGGSGGLFSQNGMFGGGMWGGQAGKVGWGGGALMGASLIAGAFQNPNGNTRISSGLSGAASGAMIGSMILPGIGTAVGAIIGGIAGLIGGADKPSNYRATATFGGGTYGLSGDKPNQNTLNLAAAAGKSITTEQNFFESQGITFNRQLSNVWIGQRDPSSYQFAGGPRVSVGSVGDVSDLVLDAVQAMLKNSTGGSAALRSVAGRQYGSLEEFNAAVDFVTQVYDVVTKAKPAMTATEQAMKALVDSFKAASTQAKSLGLDVAALGEGARKSFDQDIRLSIIAIQEPLKYALELWQRDAQARLDAAAAFGADLTQVRQLNELLRQQTISQVTGGVTAGLRGLIGGIQYGPGSAAAPSQQYFAALTDYNRAKSTALSSMNPQDILAFQSAAQSFLPIARGFLGTSQRYGELTNDVVDVASRLISGVEQASSQIDLSPVVQATNANTAVNSEGFAALESSMNGVKEELRGLKGVFEAIARRVAVG